MASKRTSDSTKNLQVPSTKRIRHDDGNKEQQHPLFRTIRRSRSATNHNIAFCFQIESLFRKVIREEITPMFDRYLPPSLGLTINGRVNPSGRRRLKLCFMNNLPQRNFTQSRIKTEGGQPLRIELWDAENQHIVRDVGLSMKIQICVLHGDFRKEDWTAEEFDKQIVIPRVGKGQLLKGDDTVITLKDGVAFINNLEFTDIIKGRTNEVRLGAKIVPSNSIRPDIREGRSEPFRVLDARGKANEKHNRPSVNDEVWRLKGIGKNGKLHTELISHGIISVKDILQLYKTNEASLREKIGKIAEKSWNKIIAHVKECDVDDDLQPLPIDSLVETSTGIQTAQYGGHDQTLQQFDFPKGLLNTDPTSFDLSEIWSSTSTSQSDLIGSGFYDQMIVMGEMQPYLPGEGNIFSEAYNFDGASQISQFGSYSLEQVNANPMPFVNGDGAGPSNHSSSLNFAVHISSNGKPKKDWQKIRSALKWFMLYTRKREQFLFIYTP